MEISLQLLGRFSFSIDGEPIDIAPAGQRVIALLAVRGGAANRPRLAGTLWPDRPDRRALANLRSALWRLPPPAAPALATTGLTLRTCGVWRVDLHAVEQLHGHTDDPSAVPAHYRRLLSSDLLPQWDEPWLEVPRERHRQQRLHVLENIAALQIESGDALDAVDTALLAVTDEPLRESAQLLLMRAHLAAGNRAAALQGYRRFEKALQAELDLGPSAAMQELVRCAQQPDAPLVTLQ